MYTPLWPSKSKTWETFTCWKPPCFFLWYPSIWNRKSGSFKLSSINKLIHPGRGCVTRRSRRGRDHLVLHRIAAVFGSAGFCMASAPERVKHRNPILLGAIYRYAIIPSNTWYILYTYISNACSVAMDAVMGGRAAPSSAPSGMLDFIWVNLRALTNVCEETMWIQPWRLSHAGMGTVPRAYLFGCSMPSANVPSNLTSWEEEEMPIAGNWVKKLKSWLSMTSSQRWLFLTVGGASISCDFWRDKESSDLGMPVHSCLDILWSLWSYVRVI